MSRDLINDNYYITSGGKIPVKWTAPEVAIDYIGVKLIYLYVHTYIFFIGTTLQKILNSE